MGTESERVLDLSGWWPHRSGMTNLRPGAPAASRPSTHQQAVLVWTAVLPTLTTLQLVLGRALAHLPEILRPVVVATLAVPIVVYVLVPRLQRVAGRLARGAASGQVRNGHGQADNSRGRHSHMRQLPPGLRWNERRG